MIEIASRFGQVLKNLNIPKTIPKGTAVITAGITAATISSHLVSKELNKKVQDACIKEHSSNYEKYATFFSGV